MASFALGRLCWGSVLIACLGVASACKSETSGFAPPRPADTSGSGGSGAGGASATGGAAPVPNRCECEYEATFDDGCSTCVKAANNLSSGACKDEAAACSQDKDCYAILVCPNDCLMLPTNQRAACITACFVPFGNDKPHQLAAAYLTCACTTCAADCGGSKPIVCE